MVVDSAMQRVDELFEMGFLEDKDLEVLQVILFAPRQLIYMLKKFDNRDIFRH